MEFEPDMNSSSGGPGQNPDNSYLQKVDYDFKSKFQLVDETFAFAWTLENFSTIRGRYHDIFSPVAVGGSKGNHSWQLRLYSKRVLDAYEFVSIFLTLKNFGDAVPAGTESIKARFQISVLNGDGYPLKQMGGHAMKTMEFNQSTSEWGWNKAILSTNVEQYLVNDSLQLHCVVWIENEVKHSGMEGVNAHPIPSLEELDLQGVAALANDLGRYFTNSQYTDVTVKAGTDPDSPPFKAHKTILCARSPVFERMFSTNMQESQENSVTIPDFDSQTVKGMLEWMYTSESDEIEKRTVDLLRIAEKYDLQDLKGKCEKMIARTLCVTNVASMLIMAHFNNASYLKQRSMELVISKKQEVVETEGFKEMCEYYQSSGIFMDLWLAQEN